MNVKIGNRLQIKMARKLTEKEFNEAVHGSILSMSKYKEGEIKEALDEFIELLSDKIVL